jgi:hypothetical protein
MPAVKRRWRRYRVWLRRARAKATKSFRRNSAKIQRLLAIIEFRLRQAVSPWRRWIEASFLFIAVGISATLTPVLQQSIRVYFDADRFAALRNLLIAAGGALIGATAIGFSVVMIAVQLNFARIPHGLFRKLSSDIRLLGAFASTFLLAILVAGLALIPNADWSAIALMTAIWSTLLILLLFFYGYRRALALINPGIQLGIILAEARKDLRRWDRRARRMAPLLTVPEGDGGRSHHDLQRLIFFQANPHWTRVAQQAVSYAMSFARRYAEQGDFEVSGGALTTVVFINAAYVGAKGRTFFAPNAFFDIPQANDGFINDTLEQLRQAVQAAAARGDEAPLRQLLVTFSTLVQTYMAIDYSNEYDESKHHAQLAASYLAGAVEAILPRRMPDVIMEGVRLMGVSAQAFLSAGLPNAIITLKEKIAAISCTGAASKEYRPVTLVGIEQLARITLSLLSAPSRDIGYAADQVRNGVELVVSVFLQIPDAPLERIHGTYLGPYYSLTTNQSLGSWLTELCNAILRAQAGNVQVAAVVDNIETWSEELYRTQKTLLLLAIEKRSLFTLDLIQWIAHVAKLLTAVSKAEVTDDHTGEEIEKHADWLFSVLSWVSDDRDSIAFVESFHITNVAFEVALDASQRDSERVGLSARRLLIDWTFKAGRYTTGWGTLETGLTALVALVLRLDKPQLIAWLKQEVTRRLQEVPLDPDLLVRTAHNLRQKAASFRQRDFTLDSVDRVMGELDRDRLRLLLREIADILSPRTAGEHVRPEPF